MKQQSSNLLLHSSKSPAAFNCVTGEEGAVLPLLVASLFSIIVIFSFAVETANLYRSKLWTQKAADAAALSAASVLAIDGVSGLSRAREAGRQVAAANLDLLRISYDASDISVDYSPSTRRIEVRLDAQAQLFILDAVPGISVLTSVPAYAEAELAPAIVSVIVDASGSMGCRPDGDCSCYPTCFPRKIDAVQTALSSFINSFDDTLDFVSLTRFAVGAEVSSAMPFPSLPNGGFDRALMQAAIDSLGSTVPVQAASNHCDGFQQAYLDSRDVVDALPEGTETFFVTLTDGSPTAGRFSFANVRAALPVNYGHSPVAGWNSHDYYSWEVDFVDMLTGDFFGRGPQELARAEVAYSYFSGGVAPHLRISETGSCSAPGQGDVAAPFSNCLNDFSFNTSGGTWKSGAADFSEFKNRYHDCALAWADTSRARSGVWYTMGFGDPCPATTGDPYEGLGDPGVPEGCRRDIYLRRLGFSRESASDPSFPDFDTFAQMRAKRYLHGENVAIDPADDLPALMKSLHERIARRTKVRLVK
jgi:Flp pilus assembly protein TadG